MALEEQTIYSTEIFTFDEIIGQINNFTKTPKDGVDWVLFSETKEIPYSVMRDDNLWEGLKPEFLDELKKLDGKKIKMSGYMFPLDQTEKQSNFLLGPFPLTCPYHSHAPMNLTIEAHAKKPVPFSYDAVTVEGVLELVPMDFEYNTFYRLKDVQISN
jgi:hypothetical protein